MESIIPTPSIDQVLQSLASNALSSAPASEEDQGKDDIVNLDSSDSESQQDNIDSSISTCLSNSSKQVPTKLAEMRIIMDKNRSNCLLKGKVQQQQNGSRQIYRINTTSSNNQLAKKPYTPVASTSTCYAPKTVSEMLNDLVNMSVDKTKENNASLKEQLGSNNNLRFVPATTSQVASSSAPPHLEPEDDIIADETNKNDDGRTVLNESNEENREKSTSVCQLSQKSSDDDDVQIIRDDNNIEEIEENEQEGSEIVLNPMDDVEAPFCKNCASEVPLIIKRLDRLDGMVDKMIDLVKNALANKANH